MTPRFTGLFALFFLLILALPAPSRAGLLTVSSPSVQEGKLTAELGLRTERSGTHTESAAFEMEYGITSFWKSGAQLTWTDAPARVTELVSVEWKNTFLFTKQSEEWPVALGLKFDYTRALENGRRDNVNMRLLASHKFDNGFTPIFNIGFRKEVGANATSGFNGDVRASLRYSLNKWATPAIDYLGDTGPLHNRPTLAQQRHRAGPVLYMKFGDQISGELGYLAGLTRAAPDHSVKFNLKYTLGN